MPFVIISIIVVMVVVVSIIKLSKTAKQNEDKQSAEKAMKVLDEKDEFKKFLDYESSSSKAPMPNSAPKPTAEQLRQREEKIQQLAKHFEQDTSLPPSKQMQIQRAVKAIQDKIDTQKAQVEGVSGSHHQSHCDTNHGGDKYRVEYVPTMNSIGGKSTEGCSEHYNTRYVKIEEKLEKHLELTQLQKIVVFGDVINNPKFKRK